MSQGWHRLRDTPVPCWSPCPRHRPGTRLSPSTHRHSTSSSRPRRYSDPENPGHVPTQSAGRSLQNQLWSSMFASCCCLSPTFFPRPSNSTCKQESADADHSWPCQHWCRGTRVSCSLTTSVSSIAHSRLFS